MIDRVRLCNLLGAIQDTIWFIHGEAIDFHLQGLRQRDEGEDPVDPRDQSEP
jgi:hypothetical protein